MEKQCSTCGKAFRVRPSHFAKKTYCSRSCMAKAYADMTGASNHHWRGGPVQKVCCFCGQQYHVIKAREQNSRFCSRKCVNQALVRPRQKKERSQPRVLACKRCGVNLGSARGVYCKACSPKGNRNMPFICRRCGKPGICYMRRPQKYCSIACRAKGDGNANWRGGRLTLARIIRGSPKNRALVASVLRRDKYKCQICGRVGGDLEVDHIKTFATILDGFLKEHQSLDQTVFAHELSVAALKYKPFWDKANLRTLCRDCNWSRHINGD